MGIEPTSKAWEALILPMNYARLFLKSSKQQSRLAVKKFQPLAAFVVFNVMVIIARYSRDFD